MKKVVIGLFMLFSIFFIQFQFVDAKENMNVEVISNTQEVKAKEEVIVTLRLDNFTDIKKGINAYKAILSYDSNIFEEVKESDFISLNNWEQLKYNPKTKELVAINRIGMKKGNSVVSVRLKVKENAKSTNAVVAFKEVVVSEGKEDLYLKNNATTISIVEKKIIKPNSPNSPNQSNQGEDKPSNSGDNNDNNIENGNSGNEGNGSNSNISKDPTSDDNTNKEPNVSKKNTIWIWLLIIAIIGLILLVYYFVKKYRKTTQTRTKKIYVFCSTRTSIFPIYRKCISCCS